MSRSRRSYSLCLVCLLATLTTVSTRGETYLQERARVFTAADGFPAGASSVRELALDGSGAVVALVDGGVLRLADGRWRRVELSSGSSPFDTRRERIAAAAADPALGGDVRDAAVSPNGELAAASATGLFGRPRGAEWRRLLPHAGGRSWAPRDVRAVCFDRDGRLWFASPQGVGRRDPSGTWVLFSGEDGLPYNDFTCAAAGERGVVWFGTTIGAIRFDGRVWEYRQGRRWLPHDEVRDIAVDAGGNACFLTAGGVGKIERVPMTLAEKARYFEAEIDRRHRRTPYEYVLGVSVSKPGEASEYHQHDSDNDGLWTAMYGAGECFAYAATKSPLAKRRATKAFEALRFLGTVTQGGSHPAPPGFVARTVLPTSGRNPNAGLPERDRDRRRSGDRMWKIMETRWPVSADGKWYWKCDTSSDELDGHYFLYAQYHDLVAETPGEKKRVRDVVVALTDHLIQHGFNLVDHDGKPTRWGRFSPEELNFDRRWWVERGLNSLSMLSYLKVAEHVSGDEKYARIARRLIDEHGYAQNAHYPKHQNGPGSGNQSDDEMAFMAFYSLLRYERDPELRSIYAYSFHRYQELERPELNPLFNYMYAAVCANDRWSDAFDDLSLAASGPWREESLDSLRRFPLDRFDWGLRNSHRLDVVPLGAHVADSRPGRGHRRDGRVLPIDERFVHHWNHDPWRLDHGGSGRYLADGAAFLLPYYMGLHHGFIEE